MSYTPPNPNGQATMANSTPVVLSSDQTAVPINGTLTGISGALPAGANIMGKVGIDQTTLGTTNNVSISGTTGAGTSVLIKDDTAFGDAVTTGVMSASTRLYNGASYDRWRGDATNGAWANIKASITLPANVSQINAVTPLMGNGVTGTGSQRVTIASDNTAFPVNATLQTGSNTIGAVNIAAAQTLATVTTVGAVTAITNALPAGTNKLGTIQPIPFTSGGLTTHTLISAATTNATSVKGTAGQLYGIQASNTGGAAAFLKLFNKATAPTVGTDVAVKTLIIPAGGGIVVSAADLGLIFTLGIAYSITGLATTADTTAVALAQCVINLDYN